MINNIYPFSDIQSLEKTEVLYVNKIVDEALDRNLIKVNYTDDEFMTILKGKDITVEEAQKAHDDASDVYLPFEKEFNETDFTKATKEVKETCETKFDSLRLKYLETVTKLKDIIEAEKVIDSCKAERTWYEIMFKEGAHVNVSEEVYNKLFK